MCFCYMKTWLIDWLIDPHSAVLCCILFCKWIKVLFSILNQMVTWLMTLPNLERLVSAIICLLISSNLLQTGCRCWGIIYKKSHIMNRMVTWRITYIWALNLEIRWMWIWSNRALHYRKSYISNRLDLCHELVTRFWDVAVSTRIHWGLISG